MSNRMFEKALAGWAGWTTVFFVLIGHWDAQSRVPWFFSARAGTMMACKLSQDTDDRHSLLSAIHQVLSGRN